MIGEIATSHLESKISHPLMACYNIRATQVSRGHERRLLRFETWLWLSFATTINSNERARHNASIQTWDSRDGTCVDDVKTYDTRIV
jgi:hypothetical protein